MSHLFDANWVNQSLDGRLAGSPVAISWITDAETDGDRGPGGA